MEKVILFGASGFGEIAYNYLKDKFDIINFCDNNREKWGKQFCGIKIISPTELSNEKCRIIITSMYYNEICLQLKNLGLGNIYIFTNDECKEYIKILENLEIYVCEKKIDARSIIEKLDFTNLEQKISRFLSYIESQQINGDTIEKIYVYENISLYHFLRGFYYKIMFKVFYYCFFIEELIKLFTEEKIIILVQDKVFWELTKQFGNIECELKYNYKLVKVNNKHIEKVKKVKKISKYNFKKIINSQDKFKENILVISYAERIRSIKDNNSDMKIYDIFYGGLLEKLKKSYNVIYLRIILGWDEAKLDKFLEYKGLSIAQNIFEEYIDKKIKTSNVINKDLLQINEDLLDKVDFSFNIFDLRNIFKDHIIKNLNFEFLIKKILAIEEFIREFNIKKIIAVDEYDVREFIVASNRCNIKSFALQHGFFTKYHYQFFNSKYRETLVPCKTFVWGEFFKKIFLKKSNLFNENNLYVVGQPITDHLNNYCSDEKEIDSIITYISVGVEEIDRWALSLMLEALKMFNDKYKLIIRLHPLEANYELYHNIIEKYSILNYSINKEEDLYSVLNRSTLVIGAGSTVLIEALLFKKKIATIISKEYGDYNDLVKNNISLPIFNSKDLINILKNLDEHKSVDKSIIESYFYRLDRNVCNRILDHINLNSETNR